MMLSDISVRRPVFAAVAAIILCVVGFAAFKSLTVRELPSVDPPVVGVSTNYRGASAEVVEERITEVIERQVAGIEGIDRVNSSSRDGSSRISISFKLNRDLDAAANDVRDAVSRVTAQLPEQADPPQIQKATADSAPIMLISFTSNTMNRLQLSDYAQRYLIERLSTVPGVANVGLGGAQLYTMRIWLDPNAMAARGLTVEDVETALTSQNAELPAGSLEAPRKDFTIRVRRGYSTPAEFARLPIVAARSPTQTQGSAAVGGAAAGAGASQSRDVASAVASQGYITRLSDIARVEEGPDERRRMFRSNGRDQVGIAIFRQSLANDLEISDGVRKALAGINQGLPKGTQLVVGVDYTEFTRHAIQEVWITMAISLAMVALVNFLFLGTARAAIIPTVVAPICILSTFIVLAPLGFSINLLTLLALVLAIGLVVDDAIVVVENIQRRVDDGEPPLVAAQRGARQVFFAVVATTIVLISVFAPLMFLPGFIGRLFVELAVSVAAAVGFSALLALSLSPMLASKLLRPAKGEGWLARNVDAAMHRLKTSYHASLEGMLGRRVVSIGAFALVAFLAVAAFVIFKALPRELTPEEDRRRVSISISGPEGSGYDYTLAAAQQLERRMMTYVKDGTLDRFIFSMPRFGGNSFNSGSGNGILADGAKITAPEFAAKLNGELSSITSVRAIISPEGGLQRGGPGGGGGGGGGSSLQLIATGSDYPEIARWMQPIFAAASNNPGLARPRLDYEPTSPRLVVNIDREKAASLGITAQTIGRALETMFGSRRVTTYIKNGQEYDVLLQADRSQRQTEQDLNKLYVRSSAGEAIPLATVVTTQVRGDTPDRPRVDRLRSINLSAQLNPGYSMGEAIAFLRAEAAKQPGSVTVKWGGGARDYLEASGSIGLAFGMALLLVFLVLAAQFESWIHPAVIMLTVPVAAVGGLFGLLMTGSSINTYSQIGLIILVGIAAKNGILIVEFANQLRDEGLNIREAVIESASLRLRPIIMTSISAAAGAIPLILWGGAGGEARKTIGVTIFFGAIFATLVTLFIVPVFYNLLARFTKSPMAMARRIEAFEDAEKSRVANAAE